VDEVRRVGESLLGILEPAGVDLVINDHPAVAAEIGAPFCHLGQEDFFDAGYTHVNQVVHPAGSRAKAQSRLRVGLSTHAPAQATRAMAARADYIAIGPVFPTGTKPGVPPVTLEYVRWSARHVAVPWFAIGGITLENLESVLEAGARRICVVSAILAAANPTRACQQFKARILSARPYSIPTSNVTP
jgi:thiamine-phosphate pyrophosphorylase